MEPNKIINIILADFSTKLLKLEADLQYHINQPNQIEDKITELRSILGEIIMNEAMLDKFQTLVNVKKTINEQV